MNELSYVIFFSLVGGLFSLVGGILLLNNRFTQRFLTHYATPFAAGSLLAAVFLDLLVEGSEKIVTKDLMSAVLVGIVVFFFIEHYIRWFHHHHIEDESEKQKNAVPINMLIFGDAVHNTLDGVAIAAAFLISVPTGIVTAIVVALHEIPQEIGDFGIMFKSGLSKSKIIVINVLCSLTTLITAVIVYVLGSDDAIPEGWLLGLSAGFLLYLAMSDIIPSIHHEEKTSSKHFGFAKNTGMLMLGIVITAIVIHIAHSVTE